MIHDLMIKNIINYPTTGESENDSMLDETNFGFNQVNYILDSIKRIINENVIELCNIWIEIGIPKSKRVNRLDEVKNLVEEQIIDLFNAIKETEFKTLNDLKDYRTSKLKEINKLLNHLKLSPFELPSNVNLFNAAKILHYKYEDLAKLKKERITKWTELKSQKSLLCNQLGCSNKSFNLDNLDTGIPSEEEVMNLQTYVLDLQKLKEKRYNEFEKCKQKLMILFENLEYIPTNDYEKQFFDNRQFILSDNNIKQLPRLIDKLESMHRDNKLNKSLKMKKLNSLWNRLDIDKADQDIVRKVIKDCKPSTLVYLESKINDLEELKKQNIGTLIAKLRAEIKLWWAKCCTSEEKIASFIGQYFSIINVDNNIFVIHEEELERLQRTYYENEFIFVKFDKWKQFTYRLNELEIKSKDPNKFNNRGGVLLQEEKERKQLQKSIPKLENELKTLAEDWSTRNDGQIFTIYGEPIEIYITNYHELQLEKEKQKINKQVTQSAIMIDSAYRSVKKNKHITLQTNASSTKRFKRLDINQIGMTKLTKATSHQNLNLIKSMKPDPNAKINMKINAVINESQFQSGIIDSNRILESTKIS